MKFLIPFFAFAALVTTSYAEDSQCKTSKCAKAACEKSCDKKGKCPTTVANTRSFIVTGLHCGSCSGKLTKALTSVEGVSAVKVCHKSGHATLALDPAKGSSETVISTITKTGFKVTGELVQVKLAKADCSGCSKALSTKLTAIEGVSSVKSVCHKSGTATVVIDPAKTTQAKVAEVVAPKAQVKG